MYDFTENNRDYFQSFGKGCQIIRRGWWIFRRSTVIIMIESMHHQLTPMC